MKRKSIREIIVEKVQQWRCTVCWGSFTFRSKNSRKRYTGIFVEEVIADFVGGLSYRGISQRREVSIARISGWIHEYGERCLSPVEMSHFLGLNRSRRDNKWSGILLVDGKYLGKGIVLLVAVDYVTQDMVGFLVCSEESIDNYKELIKQVRVSGYQIGALVSDGHGGIIGLTQVKTSPIRKKKGTRTYPRPGISPAVTCVQKPFLARIPHQWCVVHAQRELYRMIRKYAGKKNHEEMILQHMVQDILYAKTQKKAEQAREDLKTYALFHKSVAGIWMAHFFMDHWNMLMCHHRVRVKRRKVPRDTNRVENIIGYLNTRLKTLRKVRTIQSAQAIVSLIVLHYRLKPLSQSTDSRLRKKSPLELSIKLKKHYTWKSFIKKSCS